MTLLPALLLAAAGTLDHGGRAELRLRGDGDQTVFDVEVRPRAELGVRSRTWEVGLGYAPRLTLRQIDLRSSFEMLHTGTLSAAWYGPRTAVSLRGSARYGVESFSSLAMEGPDPSSPQIDRVPQTARVDYTALRAGVTVTRRASRRWLLRGSLEWQLGGGLDDASRAVVPFQSGPRGSLAAEVAATPRDRFVSALDAYHVAFSTGSEATVVTASEAWRRTLSRRAEATFRAGVAGTMSRGSADDPRSFQPYPVGEATVAYGLPADRVEVRASVWIAPVVDRLSGLVDERLQGAVGGSWDITPLLTLRGRIGAAQSVPWASDQAIRLLLGDVAMSVKVTERVQAHAGTRGALQEPRGASQWIFFAAVTFDAQTLRW